MEWISVKDMLPKQGIVCLLYQTYPPTTMFNCMANLLPRNFTIIGGFRLGKFISYQDQYSDEGLKYVSHWMPLPEPPKDNE